MPFPWAAIALLLLLLLQLATGLGGWLGMSAPYRVLVWLHGIGAYAIVVVLFAKGTIVLNALRRRPGLTKARVVLALLVVSLLTVLVTGLVWITAGPVFYLFGGSVSIIELHAFVALGLIALLAWHVIDQRWIVRVPAARNRAAFLRIAGVAVAGVVLWQTEKTLQRLLDTPGSRRRFTGSYESGSFTGGFPVVSWLNDGPDPVAPEAWRLVVDGEVKRRLELSYEEVVPLVSSTLVATLDCTGGWYSEQRWRGVELSRILDLAGVTGSGQSVLVESVTGYARRFSLADARELALATHVAGRPLSHGHGFPLRLVVPDQRGLDWVKWVGRVSVLDSTQLLQSPFPLA
jgi:DMSO/TMAO reductase YedYZ molybdopterin-dependent catalytic subunit